MINAQIFVKVGIEGVKEKKCRIFCELGFVKKCPWQLLFTKTNILKHQNCANKYMKIDFSKVIFRDESPVIFDGPDGFICAYG